MEDNKKEINTERPYGEELMVSIRCLVYNHEPYLRECLDGFVMQKTNFRFEAVVHDDCSTDNSAAIIREYAEKYPDIIKPIYETENQYSKGDGSLGRIMNAACVGKYIAMCEGDDYWIDPNKLQKQVDFLESHTDYSMCFTNAQVRNDDNLTYSFNEGAVEEKEYKSNDIFGHWIVPTASAVFKREILHIKPKNTKYTTMYGDIELWLNCANYGKVRGMSDYTSVYRIQPGSVTQNVKREASLRLRAPEHYMFLKLNYPELNKKNINNHIGGAFFGRLRVEPLFSRRWFYDFFHGAYYNPKLLFTYPFWWINMKIQK